MASRPGRLIVQGRVTHHAMDSGRLQGEKAGLINGVAGYPPCYRACESYPETCYEGATALRRPSPPFRTVMIELRCDVRVGSLCRLQQLPKRVREGPLFRVVSG